MEEIKFIKGGRVPASHPTYIQRRDSVRQRKILEKSVLENVVNKKFATIIGPRQVGKTSLLHWIGNQVKENYNYVPVWIDLSPFNKKSGISSSEWIRKFCKEFLEQLRPAIDGDIPVQAPNQVYELKSYWEMVARFVNAPRIVMLLDEANSVPTNDDILDVFYSTIRQIGISNDSIYSNKYLSLYTFVFAGVFEPDQLIRNRENSPFNISQIHRLPDFTPQESKQLLSLLETKHQVKLTPDIFDAVYKWANGHPYLTQHFAAQLDDELAYDPTSLVYTQIVDDIAQTIEDVASDNIDRIGRLTKKHVIDLGEYDFLKKMIDDEFVPFSRTREIISQLELVGTIKKAGERCVIRNEIVRRVIQKALITNPKKIELDPKNSRSGVMKQFTNGYALLIGVDEHEVAAWALPDVKKDIAALQKVLVDEERCAYLPENVKVILGKNATKAGIIDGLDWLDEKLKDTVDKNTTVVIYYSGHGWVDDEDNYYLIPYNVSQKRLKTRSLKAGDFVAEVNAIRPSRLLVVLDCCFAGGMGVKSLNKSTALPPDLFAETDDGTIVPSKSIEGLARGFGRAVLSSSTGTQPSYMRSDGKMSVFTYHLIEALTGKAQYQNGAMEVLVSDVMSYIEHNVPKTAQLDWGKAQTPTYYVTGNFPIASLLGGKGVGNFTPQSDIEATLPTQKPSNQLSTIKRERLKQQFADLTEEHKAVQSQLSVALSAPDKVKLNRIIEQLENEMADIEKQLGTL